MSTCNWLSAQDGNLGGVYYRNGTHVPEVNVCIHTLAKLLATHHYKYNSTSTKQEIDQTPGPVLLARSSLACH